MLSRIVHLFGIICEMILVFWYTAFTGLRVTCKLHSAENILLSAF